MFKCGQRSLQQLTISASRQTPLVYKPEFYVRTRQRCLTKTEFAKERVEYKYLLKQYRMKNIKEYWERQTQVENEYIADQNRIQTEKRHRDFMRQKESIVKIAAATQRHIEFQKRNEDKKLGILHKHMLNEEAKRANRQQMIKMLEFDSKTWYNLENIEEKMVGEVLVPDFVYDQTTYYTHLQEQALLYETAQFEEMEENISEHKFTKAKNDLLAPIYAEVVSIIKRITHNQETEYLEEYNHLKEVILSKERLTPEEQQEKISRLRDSYSQLIANLRGELGQTSNKINNLHEQLLFLYNLLKTWENYVSCIKMDKYEYEMLHKQKREEDEITGFDETQAKQKSEDPMKAENFSDALTSANERVTTDSASESDIETSKIAELLKNPKEFRKVFEEASKTNKEQLEEGQIPEEDEFEAILKKPTEELEQEFEEEFAESQDKEKFLYGGSRGKRAIEATELLKMTTIDSLIPVDEIQKARTFRELKLDFNSIDAIQEVDLIPDHENPQKLNTSAMIEAYKKALGEVETGESLSRKEKSKLQDIKKLLNKIGEIRVEEGRLLMKVFETYKPKYTLD